MAKSWSTTFDTSKVRAAVHQAATQGVEQAAAHVLDASQQLVPYIKGELSRSGDSGLVSDTRAAVTYRDPGAVGAHERTDIPAANGRQRKFLETALNREAGAAGDIVARSIRQQLGS